MKQEFTVDLLQVYRFSQRDAMGEAGARQAAVFIRQFIEQKGEANLIFASSPSQIDLLNGLLAQDVDWSRVNAFHMDEYTGLDIEHPSSFANYIKKHFFAKVPLKNAFYMDGTAKEPLAECRRYEALLWKYPTDITFAGIGENGHIAFNDPGIADFFETPLVKINASLDSLCRQQQVNDGWFHSLDEVPASAITITFPGVLRAKHMIITVPGTNKSEIIQKCLENPVGYDVPASIVRLHRNAQLYIDDASAGLLRKF